MRQIDEFDNFFRDRLEDFDSAPNEHEWQGIQERLHPKRRRVALWWWIPTGIAALIGSVLICRQLPINHGNPPSENQTIVTTKNQENVENNAQIKTQNVDKQEIAIKDNENQYLEKSKNKNIDGKITVRIGTKTYEKSITDGQPIVYHEVPDIATSEPKPSTENTKNTTVENTEKRPFLTFVLLPLLENSIFSEKEINLKDFQAKFTSNTVDLKKKKNFYPLKFYMGVSPTYNFKNVNPNENDNVFVSKIQNPTFASKQRIGLQLETRCSKQVSKRIGFSTTLAYQLMPFEVSYLQRKENTEVVVSSISNAGKSLNISDVSYDYEAVNIHKNLHSLSAIAAMNFHLNEKNALSLGIGKGIWMGKEKLSGSPTYASISYERALQNRLKITPYFNYHLRSYATSNAVLNIQPYQIGIKIGR
jgi:hypothetical protein